MYFIKNQFVEPSVNKFFGTLVIPYINEVYRRNHKYFDDYDICGYVERCFALDVAQDMIDPRRDDKFRIAFAVGFLNVEHNYTNEDDL